jgi:hypothetical protein
MDVADVVREVTEVIQTALKRNRRIETVLIVILASMAFTGIGLIIYGAIQHNWAAAVPGSISELAIIRGNPVSVHMGNPVSVHHSCPKR